MGDEGTLIACRDGWDALTGGWASRSGGQLLSSAHWRRRRAKGRQVSACSVRERPRRVCGKRQKIPVRGSSYGLAKPNA